MENKGFGSWGAGLLGIIASIKLLFANPSLEFVEFGLKLIGALILVFLSCLANLWAKDLYFNRIKPKLFKNGKSEDKAA